MADRQVDSGSGQIVVPDPGGGWRPGFVQKDSAGAEVTAPASINGGVPTADVGSGIVGSFGIAGAPFTSSDQSGSAVNCTDAPTTGQKLVIVEVTVTAAAAMLVTLSEESGAIFEYFQFAGAGTVSLVYRTKRKLAAANKHLQVQSSATGRVTVNAGYYSET